MLIEIIKITLLLQQVKTVTKTTGKDDKNLWRLELKEIIIFACKSATLFSVKVFFFKKNRKTLLNEAWFEGKTKLKNILFIGQGRLEVSL